MALLTGDVWAINIRQRLCDAGGFRRLQEDNFNAALCAGYYHSDWPELVTGQSMLRAGPSY